NLGSGISSVLCLVLPLALSPLLWAPLADTYGRRTTMITGCFVAFVASIGARTTLNDAAYSASRFFMGLGAGPASCVGLQMLQDISFTHERAQKVGVWTFAMDSGMSTYPLQPLTLVTESSFVLEWIPSITFGVLLFSFLAFLPETAFPRHVVQLREATGKEFDIPDPTDVVPVKEHSPFLNLQPIPGLVAPRSWDYAMRFFRMFTFPNVAVSIILYAWGWYGTFYFALFLLEDLHWEGGDSPLFYVGLLVGTFLSEIFFSGTLSDTLVRHMTRSRKIPRNPEMRLWLMWPAGTLSVWGLVLCALSFARNWAKFTKALFLAIFAVGVQMGNTTTVTYALECHPEHALNVAVFYAIHMNVAVLLFEFYPSSEWTRFSFDGWFSFFYFGGMQAIITACSVILAVGFLQVFGRKVRERRGPFPWTPAQ
ncbi:hypothetical protein FRB99_001308, partial [Tulasnella sp. 403]